MGKKPLGFAKQSSAEAEASKKLKVWRRRRWRKEVVYGLPGEGKNHWLQKTRTYHPEESFVGKVRILVDGRQHTED